MQIADSLGFTAVAPRDRDCEKEKEGERERAAWKSRFGCGTITASLLSASLHEALSLSQANYACKAQNSSMGNGNQEQDTASKRKKEKEQQQQATKRRGCVRETTAAGACIQLIHSHGKRVRDCACKPE